MSLDHPTVKRGGGGADDQGGGRQSRGEGQEDVDHLLQWTQNLDEQTLSTTPVS